MNGPAAAPRARVLVVEDSAIVLMGLESLLAEEGYEIVGPAGTLAEALGLATSERFDFALLDVNLHGQPSYELADLLIARGTPVIFTTGYSAGVMPERFAGQPTCLKPVDVDELLALIDAALVRARGGVNA